VDPRYESRLGAIRKRWHKLHTDTGNLTVRDKKRALGDEMWGSNMLAKVAHLRHAWRGVTCQNVVKGHVRCSDACDDTQLEFHVFSGSHTLLQLITSLLHPHVQHCMLLMQNA